MIKAFYKANFWGSLGKLESQAIADSIYDMSVNSGVVRGGKILQESVNSICGSLKVDGMVGPDTIAAANKLNPEILHAKISQERERYYRSIGKGSQAQFLAGWLKRIEKYNA